jgi:hypothetical protein
MNRLTQKFGVCSIMSSHVMVSTRPDNKQLSYIMIRIPQLAQDKNQHVYGNHTTTGEWLIVRKQAKDNKL